MTLAVQNPLTRDELLSQELLASIATPTALTYETRVLAPELMSEVFEPLIRQGGVGLGSLHLLGLGVLIGGITVARPVVNPVLTSYETLVFGRPASLEADIGEALQLGRLHWASGLRQRIDDYGSLVDNWDGEGAQKPSAETLTVAKTVFEKLVSYAVRSRVRSAPTTVPLSDGSIRFEWAIADKELFITVCEARAETQRWEPRDSVESVHYAEVPALQVDAELEWLGA